MCTIEVGFFKLLYIEFAHEQNCNADISESPFCGGHSKKVAVKKS